MKEEICEILNVKEEICEILEVKEEKGSVEKREETSNRQSVRDILRRRKTAANEKITER